MEKSLLKFPYLDSQARKQQEAGRKQSSAYTSTLEMETTFSS
jgi:hypothetical protein